MVESPIVPIDKPDGRLGMVGMLRENKMVKAVRKALNGHGKMFVGGLSVTAIVAVIAQKVFSNAADQWQRAVSDVPIIRQELNDHKTQPIHYGAQAIVDQLRGEVANLNVAQDTRFDDKKTYDEERWKAQAATNERLERGQAEIDSKLDRVLERLPKP